MKTPNLQFETLSNGKKRVVLPPRTLGKTKICGMVPLALGLCGTVFMVFWMSSPFLNGLQLLQQGNPGGLIPVAIAAMGLVGLYFSIKLTSIGIAIFLERVGCELFIDRDQIVVRERLGLFKIRRKIRIESIDALYIRPFNLRDIRIATEKHSRQTATPMLLQQWLPQDWCSLASTDNSTNGTIVIGYQRFVLDAFSVQLKNELDLIRKSETEINLTGRNDDQQTNVSSSPSAIKIVNQDHFNDVDIEYELPSDSKIKKTSMNGATIYRVPSTGIWRGSHGLFFFSLLWNGFMLFFTSVAIADPPDKLSEMLMLFGFIALFWAIGIGLLVAAIYTGTQKAMIGVRDGLLFIERVTMFGTKWTEFEPGQIFLVEAGESNMSVNDVPIMQLNICPVGEKTVGLFSQLSDEELHWLAQELNRDIGTNPEIESAYFAKDDTGGDIQPPAGSKVEVTETNGGDLKILVPPHSATITYVMVLLMLASGIVFFSTFALSLGFGLELLAVALALVTGVPASIIIVLMYRTRRFAILVSEDEIEVQRFGVFSDHRFHILQKDIVKIGVVASGLKRNGKTDDLLLIEGKNGDSFTMMTGRDKAEIAYVEALLRRRVKS